MPSFFKSKSDSAPVESLTTSWSANVRRGLTRTRENLGIQLSNILGGGKIDEAIYEELETVLLTADIGINATTWLLDTLRNRVKRDGLTDATQLKGALKEALIALLAPLARPLDTSTEKPFIIMLTGVNGAGKTTSIGKLTHYFRSQEKSLLLAAGDTFRAAAREQLMTWGERNNVSVVSQENSDQQKGDPAAVIFDAINAAKARNIDIVLADTAGRLATQLHLMEEIKKVKPHEVLLVLDANTGQNAVSQVKAFDDALGVTGLILTKLDGTAKGGVIAGIARQRQQNLIPLRFIGIGEGMEDLRPFDAIEFVDALFD
jgi:fused signal recognition particle receptor